MDPGEEIEVDPERRLKWIRLNAVDPGGSGSETLLVSIIITIFKKVNFRQSFFPKSSFCAGQNEQFGQSFGCLKKA